MYIEFLEKLLGEKDIALTTLQQEAELLLQSRPLILKITMFCKDRSIEEKRSHQFEGIRVCMITPQANQYRDSSNNPCRLQRLKLGFLPPVMKTSSTKRLIDIVIASAANVPNSCFPTVTALIRLDLRGPVFFHERWWSRRKSLIFEVSFDVCESGKQSKGHRW